MTATSLSSAVPAQRIPLTVIGGYLGAGKTTLINHVLRQPGGRRIAVVVNDFGSIGIDAALLGPATSGAGRIISLPNGCVCCTVGSGLQEALTSLLDLDPTPDHVIVEVSGVADPASAAAWATVPPFEPAGVVVLAAADSVRTMAKDRYVGGEVARQLERADLIVVTKSDLCEPTDLSAVEWWLDDVTGGMPRVSADHGAVPLDVVLGVEPHPRPIGQRPVDLGEHASQYVTWEWTFERSVGRSELEAFLTAAPAGVLRLKGFVTLDDGSSVVVHRVGRRSTIASTTVTFEPPGVLVAVIRGSVADTDVPTDLTLLAETHLS